MDAEANPPSDDTESDDSEYDIESDDIESDASENYQPECPFKLFASTRTAGKTNICSSNTILLD